MAEEKKVIYEMEVKADDKGLKSIDKQVKKTGESLDKTGSSAKKSGGFFSGMGKKLGDASKDMGGFTNMLSGFPKVLITATSSVLSFTKALIANPIGLFVVAVSGLIAMLALVLSKFQPFVDFISDKFAYVSGLVDGFITSLQSMGDLVKAVFSGNFKEAGDIAAKMGDQITGTAQAQEELNKALRDYEIQQKLNDATSAEVAAKMKQLEGVYKDQGRTMEERTEAFNKYYEMRKAQAEDDYNNQKNLHDKEINLLNEKYQLNVKTATEIKDAYDKGLIPSKEDYEKIMNSIIKTTELEGKVADESARKAMEGNRLRTQGLSEQLNLLKAQTSYYEESHKSILESGKKLTDDMLKEEEDRLIAIANKKKAAAQKELDIIKVSYANNINKIKEAELKKATEILKINDELHKQMNTNYSNFNKQQLDELKLTLDIYKEQNINTLKDTTIITKEELENRISIHEELKDKQLKLLEDTAKSEKWSVEKITLEKLKIENSFNEKKKTLTDSLKTNNEQKNKEELTDRKNTLLLLEELEKEHISKTGTKEDILNFKKKQAEKEYKINKEKINKLKISEEEKVIYLKKLEEDYVSDIDKIDQQIIDNKNADNQEIIDNQIQNFQDTVGKLQEISNLAIEYNNSVRDEELNRINEKYQVQTDLANETYANETKALDKKLKDGIISQDQYDKSMIKLKEKFDAEQKVADDNKASEELAAKKEAFEKNKKFQIANVAMDTASAVISAWNTTLPAPYGQILAAIETAAIIALGAQQISTIQSQTFALGGKLQGDLHAQSSGGVKLTPNVMAEGGEYVVNRASTAEYEPVLDSINSAGNGNGDRSSVKEIIDYERLSSLINDKKVFVVSSDITEQQQEDARIIEIANS